MFAVAAGIAVAGLASSIYGNSQANKAKKAQIQALNNYKKEQREFDIIQDNRDLKQLNQYKGSVENMMSTSGFALNSGGFEAIRQANEKTAMEDITLKEKQRKVRDAGIDANIQGISSSMQSNFQAGVNSLLGSAPMLMGSYFK
jgi:hypothetical protein